MVIVNLGDRFPNETTDYANNYYYKVSLYLLLIQLLINPKEPVITSTGNNII